MLAHESGIIDEPLKSVPITIQRTKVGPSLGDFELALKTIAGPTKNKWYKIVENTYYGEIFGNSCLKFCQTEGSKSACNNPKCANLKKINKKY